jgi:hypothetical protein
MLEADGVVIVMVPAAVTSKHSSVLVSELAA